MYKLYQEYLTELQNTGKYRKLPAIDFSRSNGYLDFSNNDYLCLSNNKELLDAAKIAGKNYGVGATGSRLLSGNNKIIERLENKIAQDKKTDSALIFNSGFQANLSVLATLLNQKILKTKPIVFFDRLNHASLYQAVFLSGAELKRYAHNDMEHLSKMLIKYKDDSRPKFIVAETIFGMDGDVLPINDMLELTKKHKAFLYLDEAHATGIMGENGYGLSTTVDLKNIPHLIMGTFSKALGVCGGYIACNYLLKDYLINNAPGFIYSTAISPMVIGAVSKAWDLVKSYNIERKNLFILARILRANLIELGYNIGNSCTHIIPLIFGSEEKALKITEILLHNKIIVSYIRPPTVPPGSSRIRIALNVKHTKQDIVELIKIFLSLKNE